MRAVWRQAGTRVSAYSLTSKGNHQCAAEISLHSLTSEDALAGGPSLHAFFKLRGGPVEEYEVSVCSLTSEGNHEWRLKL